MFCNNCGTQINNNEMFCHNCGKKTVYEENKQYIDESYNEVSINEDLLEKEVYIEDSSKYKEDWWSNCSKVKKIFIVLSALIIGGLALCFFVIFLREFGELLFGIAIYGNWSNYNAPYWIRKRKNRNEKNCY